MAQIQHPSSLNPWQQYRQACSILSQTSRAKNPAWYQQAIELDLQLHIRVDGPQVFSCYHNRNNGQWTDGPSLNQEILRNPEAFEPIADELLAYAKSNKASSIGVIIHVADEFATAELSPELDNPGALPEVRKTVIDDPGKVLEDATIDATQGSYRIIPYAAAGTNVIGTSITISKKYTAILDVLRRTSEDRNFPIITQSVCAPLLAILGLPRMLEAQPDKPFVTILQYPWFTVLAFFNEHADLKLIRTLQHRGMRQAANFRNALFTTSTSLEFMDPDLFILPLGEEIDEDLEQNLGMSFPNCMVKTLSMPAANGIPVHCPEPIIVNQTNHEASVVTSMTFSSFFEEGWATQDFLPMERETAEIYPEKGEMSILRMTRLIRIFIMILAVAGLGYLGLGMWNLWKMPEWSFDPGQASSSQAKLGQLNAEQRRIHHWGNLLSDRSKAWSVMESFARMFPDKGNMLIKDLKYSAKPDTTQGQNTVGFVKVWKINGYARDEAIEYLNQLNTRSGINRHFNVIARNTGEEGFRTDIGNRSITVNVRTRENSQFRPIPFEEMVMQDTTTYPFTFDLTITQRYEANDPLAIYVRSAP